MIGLFNDSFPPIMDGVAMTTYNYAYWLNKNGHAVSVVTPCAGGERFDEPFPVLMYPSLPLVTRRPYRLGLPHLWTPTVSRIHRTPFDIVHGHSPFSAGRMALSISRRQNVPLVMTFHSKFRDDFIHSVKNTTIADLMIKHIMEVFEAADEVWIPQSAVLDTIRKYGFKGHVEVVENGNDFARLDDYDERRATRRRQMGISDETPVFLFVGQHIIEKNIPFIIDALDGLRDMDYRMYFIGEGYGKQDFESKVHELGLDDKIAFMGVIKDRNILASYYAAADLFLFPSLYDNAPLVLREAAAMRTPGVLIEGSTSAEVVRDNDNGFLAPNDQTAFQSRIRDIVSDRELLSRVSLTASRTLARTWEDITEEVYDRYRHIIARKK